MKATPVSSLKSDALNNLLSGIPFYKDLMFNDPDQMKVLLTHSQLYEPEPGEVVIKKGDRDKIFYFLVSGQLAVYPDGKYEPRKKKEALSYLSAGQILGVLSLLCDAPRTATLVADPASGRVQLFGADFAPFGALTDFSKIGLVTKLVLWRMVMNNTRWKLGVYKMQNPDHPLAVALQSVETFSGEKGSIEELQSLDRQIHQLTDLMQKWNEALAG